MTDLARALAAFALDPLAVGGLWLYGRASPARDLVLAALRPALALPQRRLHPSISDEALFGGLDLALTLQAGRAIRRPGILDQPCVMILPMAERTGPGLGARLAQALDGGQHALIAMDESAAEDEALPPALTDRLGIFLDLSEARLEPFDLPDLTAARALRPQVTLPEGALLQMAQAAESLGVRPIRALLVLVALTRSLAALSGRTTAAPEDIEEAAALTLSHRALPPMEQAPEEAPPPPEPEQGEAPEEDQPLRDPSLAEIILAAARVALPPALLEQLANAKARQAPGGKGAGQERQGSRHGHPLSARPGKPATPSQLDLLASLRAAAPWQPSRRKERPDGPALILRPSDLRLKRRAEHSDRLLIFAVDASGSSAVARLAEAKGAVELFLAEAYVKRDHVALLSFRNQGAELILPPTRSLARTKSRLAGMPGGGGTPLASGLDLALATALAARRKGMTPTLAILTDGRGNIARNGAPGRLGAEADALAAARAIRAAGLGALVLDVSNRPQPGLALLAAAMGARYMALPRAQAGAMARTLSAALPD
ncbi:magnesium chelatase subunit D [Stagnihabitans tardus]|uniref:Magnesium chelatase subunit D n=1 Tax=Stagnihabitans tardus TaxID=2699202 RepID=A0AAE4YB64_9RHOB|nr:magnesium chelatase subunit D [Stagnihabitans tardus]NBZ86430.1 magnesium chelatase subunit D [Stagnihabitans tardus]